MSAGDLDTPIKFQRRAENTADRFGRGGGAWRDLIALTWARKRAKGGGDTNQAARLEQRVPYEFLIRDDPDTRGIGAGDRIEDLETRETFNIRAIAPFEANTAYRLITAEAGGADG